MMKAAIAAAKAIVLAVYMLEAGEALVEPQTSHMMGTPTRSALCNTSLISNQPYSIGLLKTDKQESTSSSYI